MSTSLTHRCLAHLDPIDAAGRKPHRRRRPVDPTLVLAEGTTVKLGTLTPQVRRRRRIAALSAR